MRLTDLKMIDNNVNISDYLSLYDYVRRNMEHPEWIGKFTQSEVEEILNKGGKIWIYYDKNIPVCSMFYMPVSNKTLRKHNANYDEEETGSLGPIMVRKEYVGNGLQTAMLNVLNDYVKSMGKKYIFTKAHSDNIYSIRNILSDGYKIVDEFKDDIGLMIVFIKRII